MPMLLSAFDYTLPSERIAQSPVHPRDHSKLLVLDKETGSIKDHHFYDLPSLLTNNDVLVINDTKVFPARLHAQRESGSPIEILLGKEVEVTAQSISFEVLSKPGLKLGQVVTIPHTSVQGICTSVHTYTRTMSFSIGREEFFSLLNTWAKTPIPPYIRWNSDDEQSLRSLYQTVYATRVGAVAAPTAGLHFTTELLQKLTQKGIEIETVTLHVGAGTFLPVKTEDITQHEMHAEVFSLSQKTADRLNDAKKRGKRIIAVGTTTVRVLESCTHDGKLIPTTGETSIFIYPPYAFAFVDALITNFHTPKSTLLMLISAFVSAPNTPSKFTDFLHSRMGKCYQHALDHNYRFYSFGDAMFIR